MTCYVRHCTHHSVTLPAAIEYGANAPAAASWLQSCGGEGAGVAWARDDEASDAMMAVVMVMVMVMVMVNVKVSEIIDEDDVVDDAC